MIETTRTEPGSEEQLELSELCQEFAKRLYEAMSNKGWTQRTCPGQLVSDAIA